MHLGSLTAALISYLDARANKGAWLLRIEDIDPPREQKGAAENIINALESHHLFWDDEILWQSQRLDAYAQLIEQLLSDGRAFFCQCSRKQLVNSRPYPGTCRLKVSPDPNNAAIRLNTGNRTITLVDLIQGEQLWQSGGNFGDFVIRRRDRLPSYQLAVTLDDCYQGITHVVRGIDLLDSTPNQICLMNSIGAVPPRYAHFPVVVDKKGIKLSKQTFALPIDLKQPKRNLLTVLKLLGWKIAPETKDLSIDELVVWAIARWDLHMLPNTSRIEQ